ncbi:Erv25p LALA0_S02e00166g [Lachancea lanzarotensis]|uniref:LALA0S02e00166g1_1 n=1 Tax=Lachancea lanzarotensis TaxID=1245769 RepID=A0A0C7N2M3_9SACH|nr:uncharacterized protein LALA0_S02e00166g [Lachancea lanzarotensis]CEP60811.1 LALA0S02e00166g1_1 [Lachancea lanzarotensis]
MQLHFLAFLCAIVGAVAAVQFEIAAFPSPEPVCIRDFVSEGQLVLVNIKTDGSVGDGQVLSVVVRDNVGHEYRRMKNIAGPVKIAFTASSSAAFDVCFENQVQSRGRALSRKVELDIESGSEARDWSQIQSLEKLKPVEVELRRIEELTDEIVDELTYLKAREERLRDTNESTNRRVRNFSVLMICVLLGLGAWQINYLHNYFKSKHII